MPSSSSPSGSRSSSSPSSPPSSSSSSASYQAVHLQCLPLPHHQDQGRRRHHLLHLPRRHRQH